MPKQTNQPARKLGEDRKETAAGSDVRARLLRMIVANEQARKPKSQ